MKKRILAFLLTLVLLAAAAAPAFALEEDSAVIRTVKALGIMVGDENGNLNLSANVTRAQYAKMLVAASKYKDSISPDGTGYSLYRDLKSDHWASEYVRIAVQERWMTGYTDSTWRPENTITLEEVCAATLRLLGYDDASLVGSFPYAHLSKASALGLRDDLACVQGQNMTRQDCAQMIYNLFSAQTASGQVYGTTLGLTIRDGEVDYISVLMDKLSGPYVASAGTTLPFTPLTVFRDGKASSFASLSLNDVYYYNAGMRSLWIYTKRVTGKIESVSSSNGTPGAVTVSGKSYTVGSTDAAYQLSALAGTAAGSYVTLLLGMEDKVAGVLSGGAVNGTYYGVVQSAAKSAADSKAVVQTEASVFCTDGVVRSFVTQRDLGLSIGSVVAVSITDSGVDVHRVSSSYISGRVDAEAKGIGSRNFAKNVEIIDASADGTAVVVKPSRLAKLYIEGDDVRFYSTNIAGEIEKLILNDLTSDTWTYAYLTEAIDPSGAWGANVTYTYISAGKITTFSGGGKKYAVEPGGIALRYETTGGIKSMRPLEPFDILRLENGAAMNGDTGIPIAENVQVYLVKSGSYYLTELSAVNTYDYLLSGWYDNFSGKMASQIRIILAIPKGN